MRSVVYTVIFQITSIIIFGLLYWKFSEDFTSSTSKDTKYKIPFLDCFYTSVTIQAYKFFLNPLTIIYKNQINNIIKSILNSSLTFYNCKTLSKLLEVMKNIWIIYNV